MTPMCNERGFQLIEHNRYPSGHAERIAQQSSAVGNYPDSLARAGSSYLWIGTEFHLNREEVAELVKHLDRWVKTGHLFDSPSQSEPGI